MLKKLLVLVPLLCVLALSFALLPSHAAHADSCNGVCGADPVQAGCAANQYIVNASDFWVGSSEWEIRLRSSNVHTSACTNKAWASLVLLRGSNGLSLSNQFIQVDIDPGPYDILYAAHFYSGAYTNMIPLTVDTCVNYSGGGINAGTCY